MDLHYIASGSAAYILLMPKSFAAEDLFEEFDAVLEECVAGIFDSNYALRLNIKLALTRAAGTARRRVDDVRNMDDAKKLLRNEQDVKDIFWKKVAESDYKLAAGRASTIKALIDAAE